MIYLYETTLTSFFTGTFWDQFCLAAQTDPDGALVVVPTARLKTEVLAHLSIAQIHPLPLVMTLDELLLSTAPLFSMPETGVDRLWLSHVLEEQGLTEGFWTLPGIRDQIVAFSDQCEKFGWYPKDYQAFCQAEPFGRDILAVLDRYRAGRQRDFPTMVDLYKRRRSWALLAPKLKGKSLYLIGFWDLSDYQKPFLEWVIETVDMTSMVLARSMNPDADQAVVPLRTWIERLSVPLRVVVQALAASVVSSPAEIDLRECAGVEDEVHYMAQYIQAICADSPESGWDRVGVIVPNFSVYQPVIERVFDQYGIPTRMPRQSPLSTTGIGRLVAEFLSLCFAPVSPHRLLGFFSSELIRPAMSVDMDVFKELALQRFYVGHLAEWKKNCHDYVADLRSSVSQVAVEDSVQSTAHLDALEDHLQLVDTFCGWVDRVKSLTTISEFERTLTDLLENWGIPSSIAAHPDSQVQAMLVADLAEFRRALSVFCQMHARFSGPQFQSGVATRFTEFLSSRQVERSRPVWTGVDVLGRFEAVLVRKDVVFICGLYEGNWPAIEPDNPFCSVALKAKWGWPGFERFSAWDDYLFEAFIAQAGARVVMTYPSMVQGSRQLRAGIIDRYFAANQIAPPEAQRINGMALAFYRRGTAISKIKMPDPVDPEMHDRFRWGQDGGPATGRVDRLAAAGVLAEWSDSRHYSVTQLEMYQQCPYQFMWRHLAGLREPAEFSDEISALIWGQLVHRIFYEIYQKIPRPKLSDRAAVYDIARSVFARYSQSHLYWQVKETILFGEDGRQGLLDSFLRLEDGLTWPYFPVGYEVPFDEQVEMEGTRMRLKGTIDVVLVHPQTGARVVLDYKTGMQLPTASDVRHLRSLQLPLYDWVLHRHDPDSPVVGGVIYQVKDDTHLKKQVMYVTPDAKPDFDLGRKRPALKEDGFYGKVSHHVMGLKTVIENGQFSPEDGLGGAHMPSSRGSVCRRCAYVTICRYPGRFEGGSA